MAEYLEREALLRELRLWHMHKTDSLPDHFHYTGIKAWLEALPAEDVQPVKHGRWVESFEQIVDLIYKVKRCSICGKTKPMKIFEHEDCLFNYCPNCGAKMDGEDNG